MCKTLISYIFKNLTFMQTEPQFNTSKLSKIMSYIVYRKLEQWVADQQGTVPTHAKLQLTGYIKQMPHREYHSRLLEKIILKMLNKSGAIAQKVKNTGKFMDKTQHVTDVLGRVRQIGSKDWVRDANVIKGMADIRAEIKGGKTWYIEVKIDDRQSGDQKEFEVRVKAIRHTYTIIRTVDEFLHEYFNLTGEGLI